MPRRLLSADTETPVSLFLALESAFDHVVLFESVEGGERWARNSLIAVSRQPSMLAEKPEDIAPMMRQAIKAKASSLLDGVFGYFTYEAAQAFIPLEGLPRAAGPLAEFFRPEAVILFDHKKQTISIQLGDAHIEDEIMGLLAAHRKPAMTPFVTRAAGRPDRQISREAYMLKVERAKDYIVAGDAFQIVVSQGVRVPDKTNLIAAYRHLRRQNPSPYLFYLRTPTMESAGASPETLVRVEDGMVTVRPIAGTRPRGQNESEDRALAESLLGDEKERAEHLMLVDLGRNDVGRVAAPGSVVVDPFMHIERYSHVMHLVSDVRGQLAEGKTSFDAFASTFPAGTLSGAPKRRAMEIIAELEAQPRGLYGGAVGYFSDQTRCDFAIAIRTLWRQGGKVHAHAGAGIVYDSLAAREDDECLQKLASPLLAAQSSLEEK